MDKLHFNLIHRVIVVAIFAKTVTESLYK